MNLKEIKQLTDNFQNLDSWKEWVENSSLEELKKLHPSTFSRLPKEFQYFWILERFKKTHNNRYNYSRLTLNWFKKNYKNKYTKIPIVCPIHGEFYQMTTAHLSGQGCPQCQKENLKLSYQKFIEKASKIHNNKYTYPIREWWDKNYKGNKTKIPIICPQHGEFYQSVSNHLVGYGCLKCSKEQQNREQRLSYQEFLEKANKVHNNKYQYPFDENWWNKYYRNRVETKIPIVCPQHGEFQQSVNNHLSGQGCSICGIEKLIEINKLSYQDFIKKAKEIHGDKYIYPFNEEWWQKNYINNKQKVSIICPQHGEFQQDVYNHLQSHGCPKCFNNFSRGEEEIRKYIELLGFKTEKYRDSKFEIDIFVSELNLGFEYNGIRWHSDQFKHPKYHQEKSLYFAEKGIKLIHIWEDWWSYKKDLVLSFIRNQLGKSEYKIYARKCEIRQLKFKDVRDFLDKNHFQGAKSANLYYGLFYQDKLIQVLTFFNKKGYWEIDRFATEKDYSIIGGFSKLFKQFLRDVNPNKIVTFSAIDLNNLKDKSVYAKAGFKLVSITDPSYFYANPQTLIRYSRNHFQKHKLLNYNYLKLIITKLVEEKGNYTEREVMDLAGWYRFYNAGNFKWIWES